MVPLPGQVKATFGVMPKQAPDGAEYCDEAELANLEARGADAGVAPTRDGRSRPTADPVRCPATRRMAEKLATPQGKARYAKRKWLSEAPNGWIKEAMGFRRFSVQDLAKARGERGLAFLAPDVRRMGRLAAGRRPANGRFRAGIPACRVPEGGLGRVPGAIPAPRAHAFRGIQRSGRHSKNPRRPSLRLPARQLPRRRLL